MRSMTGYGVGRVQGGDWEITAELKTVNHRFLDLALRLPREIAFLEPVARETVSAGIRRGHVEVFLNVRRTEGSSKSVLADTALAKAYADTAERLAKETGLENDLTVGELMEMDGVVTLEERETDHDMVCALCAEALREAVSHVTDMREREGERLRSDLMEHLEAAETLRDRIRERAPGVVADYRERLESRLSQMGAEGVDPQRLAQEVALMADRCAIDEEISRLSIHIGQMKQYLDADGEIGKKMDFLVQEMNREANTIGSKASDAAIAQMVVDLKSEIEKLREQIQNVE